MSYLYLTAVIIPMAMAACVDRLGPLVFMALIYMIAFAHRVDHPYRYSRNLLW